MGARHGYLWAGIMVMVLWSGCSRSERYEMPKTETDNITTDYFGTAVSDPYRWLEDAGSQKVKSWIDEQNRYADTVLSGFTEAPRSPNASRRSR